MIRLGPQIFKIRELFYGHLAGVVSYSIGSYLFHSSFYLSLPMQKAFDHYDILHKDAGCVSELDYAEQTSWI